MENCPKVLKKSSLRIVEASRKWQKTLKPRTYSKLEAENCAQVKEFTLWGHLAGPRQKQDLFRIRAQINLGRILSDNGAKSEPET